MKMVKEQNIYPTTSWSLTVYTSSHAKRKHISHNTPCLSTKILLNLCFSFLLGSTAVPREIEKNACAKFLGANKVHFGKCASGECNCQIEAKTIKKKNLLGPWIGRCNTYRLCCSIRVLYSSQCKSYISISSWAKPLVTKQSVGAAITLGNCYCLCAICYKNMKN